MFGAPPSARLDYLSQTGRLPRRRKVMNTQSTDFSAMREIEAFETRYGYDATYMKEMLEAAPEAYRVFGGFLPMAQFRSEANPEVYFTAGLTAFREVDCGPCLQLAVRKAREAGVDAALIREILGGESLPDPLETVRQFARSILRGTLDCEDLRAQLVKRLGAAAVVELALAVASAQVFPVVKRAMGHYRSCSTTPLEV